MHPAWSEPRPGARRASPIYPDVLSVATPDCPWCAHAMSRGIWGGSSGVLIDRCDACGLWLEPGELEQIEAWTEATEQQMAQLPLLPFLPPGRERSHDAPLGTWDQIGRGSGVLVYTHPAAALPLLAAHVIRSIVGRARRSRHREAALQSWIRQQREHLDRSAHQHELPPRAAGE